MDLSRTEEVVEEAGETVVEICEPLSRADDSIRVEDEDEDDMGDVGERVILVEYPRPVFVSTTGIKLGLLP